MQSFFPHEMGKEIRDMFLKLSMYRVCTKMLNEKKLGLYKILQALQLTTTDVSQLHSQADIY